MSRGTDAGQVRRARDAVAVVFAINGFAFASWVSRIPEVRSGLRLSPGELGALLLSLSIGSLLALPSTGAWVHRFGAAGVVAVAAVVDALGVVLAGLGGGALGMVWPTAVGLFLLGFGSGGWDVAMNVEGAAVERRLGRTIMPRFHAAFSLGTVLGAGVGVAASSVGVGVTEHLTGCGVLVALVPVLATRRFLPAAGEDEVDREGGHLRTWSEPRTLAIGLMVLAMALTEGVANDWLAVALVDGYDVPAWAGAGGYAIFVSAMTAGRVGGTVLLDRFGRLPVLWSCMGLAGLGVVLVVYGGSAVIVVPGILLWGIGASLGFPVGMSAASDDPRRAAARVSVVSTIGYTAFLAGPPVLGFVGGRVGVLHALLLVAVLLVPSAFAVPAARPRRS
jgi:hypothetical protein